MIDGDVQATILANYFNYLLERAGIQLKLGIVLSYYSNSACFSVLKNFETEMVQTGVKNFVKAAKKYDIGIYFEPNGHGSVVFSNVAISAFESGNSKEHSILQVLSTLFDPNVGDALANVLIFKSIIENTSNLKTYKDNGSRLLAVKITNKNSLSTNEKNIVTSPKLLQEKIDCEIEKYQGRAFVRPSGTEDLVRVYAECANQQDADILCLKVAQHVYDMCDGVDRKSVV